MYHSVIILLLMTVLRRAFILDIRYCRGEGGDYQHPHSTKPIEDMSSQELHEAANKCLREFKL